VIAVNLALSVIGTIATVLAAYFGFLGVKRPHDPAVAHDTVESTVPSSAQRADEEKVLTRHAEWPDDFLVTGSRGTGPNRPGSGRVGVTRHSRTRLIGISLVLALVAAVAIIVLTQTLDSPAASTRVSEIITSRSYPDGLGILRRWTLSGHDGSWFSEEITAHNATDKPLLVSLIEPVPTAIAPSLQKVHFTAGFKIVNAGRAVEWNRQVNPHGKFVVGYQVRVLRDGATNARLEAWAKGLPPPTVQNGTVRLRPGSLTIKVLSKAIRIFKGRIHLTQGQTVQLSVTGLLTDGKPAPAALLIVTWLPDPHSKSAATVNAAGLLTARRQGTARVIAKVEGSNRATVLVIVVSRHSTPSGPGPVTTGPTVGPSSPSPSASPSRLKK